MFGSNILETAIGLIFVYLGFSLLCSGLREWIAVVLNTRSRTLKKGILNMLKDDTRVNQVLKHHLVRVKNLEGRGEQSPAPKYISSKAFAQALLEGILKAQKEEKVAPDSSTASTPPAGEKKAVIIEGMKKSIAKIENSHVKNTLLDVLESTEKRAPGVEKKSDNAKKVIEDWFNDEMELLSAWYKKQTHRVLLVLAILFCVFFNVDTIMITRTLSVNAVLRQSLTEAVQQTVKEPVDNTSVDSVDSYQQGEKIKAQIQQLGLPIGWTLNAEGNLDPRALPRGFWNWFYKVLGILMSVLAVSMGAPFWFDILKKLINISSKPKSPEESSTVVVKAGPAPSDAPAAPAPAVPAAPVS